MKINQFNINSYVTISTKSTIQSVSTRTITSKTGLNVMDSVRLSNMKGELRTNQAIQGNIQSGISLIQTMDASLSSAEEMGNKLKELAIKYQNGVNTDEDKQLIEKEANEILKGLQKLFEETTFNGQKVFDKPNFGIYTGGKDSYKIETPNVSTIKEIKPIEVNATNKSLDLEVNLPLLQIQSEKQTLSDSLNIQETAFMSVQPMTLSRTNAISAYQESSQIMASSSIVQGEDTTTQTVQTQQTTQSSKGQSSSTQQRKDFTATMQELFGSKKEAREFFGAKNDKQMFELAKQETTESLQQRFVDKGYADKLNKAEELGLYEMLGLERPKKTEPNQPNPTEPTNPSEEPEVPIEGTNPGGTDGTGNGNGTGDGTGSTEPPTPPEENDGTGNNGGNNGTPTEPSNPTNPTNPTLPNEGGDGSSDGESSTDPTNPSNPSKPPNQWNFADILKEDFIDKNILGVIKKGASSLRVQADILQSRLNFQERTEEITAEQISRINNADMAKSVMEEIKKQMLSQVREALQVHQIDQEREFILKLLQPK